MHKRGGIAQNFIAPNRFIYKLLQKNRGPNEADSVIGIETFLHLC